MNANRFLATTIVVVVAAALLFAGLLFWQQARVLQAHDAYLRDQAHATQRLVEAQHRDVLSSRAELIATDPGFAAYVEQAMGGGLPGMPVDTTSIVDLLRERQNQLGLSASAVLDAHGRIVASTADLSPSGTLQGDPLFERARAGVAVATGVRAQDDAFAHVAVLPLAAVGVSQGFLLVARPIDLRFAQTIASATGADVMLQRSDNGRVLASTLAFDDQATSAKPADVPAGAAGESTGANGTDRPVFDFPLMESGLARLVVVAPEAPRAALADAVRVPWLVACALSLLGLAGGGWLLWRRVLRPVEAIAGRLDRASQGDHRLQFPEDEAGAMASLASAFNRLMASLRV